MSRILLISLSLGLLLSCGDVDDYYLSESNDPEVAELYTLVAGEENHAVRAVAVEELSRDLLNDKGPHALNAYLTSLVEHNPDDGYGAFYLSIVAQNYLDQGAIELARYYYERVIAGYPDVVVRNVSYRRRALEQVVRLTSDAAKRVLYYNMLLDEYKDSVDRGLIYYRLAENYEKLGDWDAAYGAYRTFLQYPETVVPGKPNAYRDTTDRIEFYDSPKNWTISSLEELRRGVTSALVTRNPAALETYQAGVNFFTMSWEQDAEDPNVSGFWDIGEILSLTRRLTVKPTVDLDEDGDEAYLYTHGWGGQRIKTWYLYFRKVNFPPDPDIHGTWEWAGVFLGERL